MAAYHQVHDYACVSLQVWCEVVAAHHRVMSMHTVTCRPTAHCGIGSVPQHSAYDYGTNSAFTVHLYAMLLSCPFLLSCSAVKDVTHETERIGKHAELSGPIFVCLISGDACVCP